MKKLLLSLATTLLLLTPLAAQDLETGYFLGGNPFAFRQNPAFQSERNILSIGLGMTGVNALSNLGVSTLLYPDPSGNKMYTLLNDRVKEADVMGKLHRNNYVDADANLNILTVGFWSGRNFFTIDINARNQEAVSLPYDLFRFLKGDKSEGNVYDIPQMGVSSQTYAEAAFGWSRDFGAFRLGARSKFIVGALEERLQMQRLKLTIGEESWAVESLGTLELSSPAVTAANYDDSSSPYLDPSSLKVDWDKAAPAGYGGAIDLGFSWDVLPLLTLSGAILDLGAVRWNREHVYKTPDAAYSWAPSGQEGYDQGDVEKELNALSHFFSDLARWYPDKTGAAWEMLPARFNLGAEFRMPFYDRLSVGALYQGRLGGAYARHTGRVSLNWNPLDFLSMSGSATLCKLGESLGFALNLHPAGINLLLGCDYIPLHVMSMAPMLDDLTPQQARFAVIPRDRMNLNLYLALNIAFGRNRLDHARRFVSK